MTRIAWVRAVAKEQAKMETNRRRRVEVTWTLRGIQRGAMIKRMPEKVSAKGNM